MRKAPFTVQRRPINGIRGLNISKGGFVAKGLSCSKAVTEEVVVGGDCKCGELSF